MLEYEIYMRGINYLTVKVTSKCGNQVPVVMTVRCNDLVIRQNMNELIKFCMWLLEQSLEVCGGRFLS